MCSSDLFSLEYPLWHRWPGGYRLVNLLLHAINGFLIFLVARDLLQSAAAASAVSAIYLVHPAHTEAVISLIGRGELLACLFFLLAWLLFRGRHTVLCGLAFLFSLLSKENAIMFPAVIVLDTWISETDFRKVLSAWKRFIPVAAATAVYFGLRLWVLGGIGIPKTAQYLNGSWTFLQRELTSGRAFLKYFQLLLAPVNVTGDYDFNSVPLGNVTDAVAWMGLLLVAATIGLAFWILKKQPILGFSILFFYLTMFPVSNWIFPTSVIMAERFLYLPSLGICLIGGILWSNIREVRTKKLIAAGIMSIAVLLCVGHNYVWRDNLSFYGNIVRVFPNNVRGRQGFGIALLEKGRPEEARAQFEAGLRIDRDAPLLVGLASTLMQVDHTCVNARPVLTEALSIQPSDPFAQWLLGNCIEGEGNTGSAEQMYRNAIGSTAFPDPKLLFDWGYALERLGRPSEALNAYRRAALLDPGDALVQRSVARVTAR